MSFWSLKSSIHWRTPPEILEFAAEVFGGSIDLDPCAPLPDTAPPEWGVNEFATVNYRLSEGKNGLTLPWHGNVFINPPFGTSYVKDGACISSKEYGDLSGPAGWAKQTADMWVSKVLSEVDAGISSPKGPTNVIWLSKAPTETKAMQRLLTNAPPRYCSFLMPKGRVNYVNASTRTVETGVTFPSIVVGLGSLTFIERFESLGSGLGVVARPV